MSRLASFDLDDTVARLRTARSADTLCAQLRGKQGKQHVETLASFKPETSARALLDGVGSAADTVQVLEDDPLFYIFSQLIQRSQEIEGAEELIEQVRSALRQDETVVKLAPRLRELSKTGQALLTPPASTERTDPLR